MAESLKEFAERMMLPLETNFNSDQSLTPMWIIQGSSGVTVIATPWADDMEKELSVQAIKRLMKKEKASRYVQLSEVWTVQREKGKVPPLIGRVSEQRDRQEAVMAMAADKDGNIVQITRLIQRDAGGRGILLPPNVMEFTSDECTGLMANLLTE